MPSQFRALNSALRAPSSALRVPRSPLASRRDFLYGLGLTLGSAALSSLLSAEEHQKPADPLAAKPPHHPAKARACISLFMEGGPSHIDTFDPKPKLADLHLTEFTRQDRFASGTT
jgi:hypothetical protein